MSRKKTVLDFLAPMGYCDVCMMYHRRGFFGHVKCWIKAWIEVWRNRNETFT